MTTAVATKGIINLGSKGMDLARFLNIGEITDEVKNKVASMLNIKDAAKKALSEVLVDRWMFYKIGDDTVYVKHIPSDRANVLYQIIISGQEWDGVYELALKGKAITARGYNIGGKNVLSIESRGNYNLAVFGQAEDAYSISRIDFNSAEEFKQALLDKGFVTEDELDIYYKPLAQVRPYLERVLPQIVLK